jgi:hypothetical protein
LERDEKKKTAERTTKCENTWQKNEISGKEDDDGKKPRMNILPVSWSPCSVFNFPQAELRLIQ